MTRNFGIQYTITVTNRTPFHVYLPLSQFSRSRFMFKRFNPSLFVGKEMKCNLSLEQEQFTKEVRITDCYYQVVLKPFETALEPHQVTDYSLKQALQMGIDHCDMRIQLPLEKATKRQVVKNFIDDDLIEEEEDTAPLLLYPGGTIKSNSIPLSLVLDKVL